jgi:hypothetical protein
MSYISNLIPIAPFPAAFKAAGGCGARTSVCLIRLPTSIIMNCFSEVRHLAALRFASENCNPITYKYCWSLASSLSINRSNS